MIRVRMSPPVRLHDWPSSSVLETMKMLSLGFSAAGTSLSLEFPVFAAEASSADIWTWTSPAIACFTSAVRSAFGFWGVRAFPAVVGSVCASVS